MKEMTVDKPMFALIVGVALVLGIFVGKFIPCDGIVSPTSAKAYNEETLVEFDMIQTNKDGIIVLRDRKLGVMYLVNEEYGHGGMCVIVNKAGRPLILRD